MQRHIKVLVRLSATAAIVTVLSAFGFAKSTKTEVNPPLSTAQLRHRLNAEIAFAEKFSALYPRQAEQWHTLIERAKAVLEQSDSSDETFYTDTVQPVERILAPIGAAAKTYTVHCIGHAHIDMNWKWSWPETVAVTNDTLTTVLKLMDEFDDFYFSQSQASVYDIIREHNPALFEQIKKKVAEGRWEVTATQWVEGDKNIASGESIARHLLYTREFMKDHFNLRPEDVTVCWEPDTFGHAYSIPTILTKGGVKRYYLFRCGSILKSDRDKMPRIFWWEGPDGSRLLVYNAMLDGYNGHIGDDNIEKMISFARKTGLKDWMRVYGVGDHGGGPTRQDILNCLEMNSWPIYPNFKMGRADHYFDLIETAGDRFPVVKKELNFEFAGCYTSQSEIKKFTRFADSRLKIAETAALLANVMQGPPWPRQQLHKAWIDTLFGHFHDILPGSCVRWAREYQSGLYQATAAATGTITANSLRQAAAAIDTSFAEADSEAISTLSDLRAMGAGAGAGAEWGDISSITYAGRLNQPFIVFNPTTTARKEIVTVQLWDLLGSPDSFKDRNFTVRTPDGRILKAQYLGYGSLYGHRHVDLAFPADVGAMGYAAYVVECDRNGHATGGSVKRSGEYGIENEFIKVEFDPATGGICSFIDKTTGRDLAIKSDPLGVFEYILEAPGSSAWIIKDPIKRICPLNVISVKSKQQGPYICSFESVMKLNDSTITAVFSLSEGQSRLDIDVSTFWLERGSEQIGTPSLRIQFPFAFSNAGAAYEIPFGSIERGLNHGEEVPAINWADVTGSFNDAGETAGCVLLNDCKSGHSLDNSTLRLTLLRSTYRPDPLPEMGEHTMRMALSPHRGKLPADKMIALGTNFNQQLQIMATDIHKGRFPAKTGDLVSVSSGKVVIAAVKKSENGSGILLRLLETAGNDTAATITLDKTVFGSIRKAVQTDLLERPVASGIKKTQNSFTVTVPANGIVSVLLDVKK